MFIAIAYSGFASAAYTLIPFDYPGSMQTQGFGINGRLQVAGFTDKVGFIYDFVHKSFSVLPPGPSGLLAEPIGLNDLGISVGTLVDTSTGNVVTGFVFDGSSYTLLDHGSGTQGRGINNAGFITGFTATGEGDTTTPWFYDPRPNQLIDIAIPGPFTIIQGINSAGDIVGSTRGLEPDQIFPGSVFGLYGFVRTLSGSITFFRVNGLKTRVRGINDLGQVVGSFDDNDGLTKGFITAAPSGGGYVTVSIPATEYIVAPGYDVTFPLGINNAGFISGTVNDLAGTVSRGFVAVKTNYGGLWWNAGESGWGINVAHQGDSIFATWFTYDTTGKEWWLSMTANKTASNPDTYSGQLIQTHGPAFSAVPFDPAQVTRTVVGNGSLTFTDANNGSFAYSVTTASSVQAEAAVQQNKAITRQVFGALPTCSYAAQANPSATTNYSDLWWASPAQSEAGWGINLAHQGANIFATWFTYDTDGTPLWLSSTLAQGAGQTFSGALIQTAGPAFSSVPFDPNQVTRTNVGNATLTFADGNTGSFDYTAKGVTQHKTIIRQLFNPPAGTVCF